MEFAEKHKSDANKFVILTVHAPDRTSEADLAPNLKQLSENLWKGKKFELPVLFDKSGRTFKDYGIAVMPQAVLIDPAGRIVIKDWKVAAQMLESELEKTRSSK